MKEDTQCTECGKKYKINLSNVKAQYVKFTCHDCQKINVLENPGYRPGVPSNFQSKQMNLRSDEKSSFSLGVSIRTKIIAAFVLLVLISLSVVGWYASTRSRNALADQAEAFLDLNAKQKSREYALTFERIQQEVEAVASFTKLLYEKDTDIVDIHMRQHILMPWSDNGYGSPQMEKDLRQEILTVQQLAPFLISIVPKNPFAQAGYFGSATRIMVMNSADDIKSIGQLKGYENIKRGWYLKAQKEGRTIWSDPYVDASTKDLIVTCATPVKLNDGRMVGVAAYDVLLSTIQKDILTLNIGYNSYAILVSNKGTALVRPGMNKGDTRWDATYETTDLLSTANKGFNSIISNMISGRAGVETYDTEEGEKYIAYSQLPAIGASMAIVASKSEVVAPAVAIQKVIMLVWGLVLVVAVALGFYIGNGITKPINELTQAADRISQGEMDLEILTEDRKDEIGRLTQAFNRLVTSLKIAMSVR